MKWMAILEFSYKLLQNTSILYNLYPYFIFSQSYSHLQMFPQASNTTSIGPSRKDALPSRLHVLIY